MSDEKNTVSGLEYIRDFAKHLPKSAGVYRMFADEDVVLYVGKAKQLKNRVTNYTNPNNLSSRIMRMVSQTKRMEIITTRSEAEALLLEANLIKKHRPPFNILLKDDKSYSYIAFTAHEYPQIFKHRGAQKKGEVYFGPFASTGAVNHSLEILQRIFLLRPCADSIFAHRSRPCLQYQIKRCSAPCVGRISKEDYHQSLTQAYEFLNGKSRDVQTQLAAQMEAASAAMEFELAASLRDRIRALAQIQQDQSIYSAAVSDADVIGVYRDHAQVCIQVFFYRAGQHYGNRSFFPSASVDATDAEILEAFLGQYYQSHAAPKLVLLSHETPQMDVLQEALNLDAPTRIKLEVPKRGDKYMLVTQAVQNAKDALLLHVATRKQEARHLEALAKLFDLPATPERVEVYDNSHVMGTNAVGGMVVAGADGFMKSSYRKFNIDTSTLVAGDDYAMMRQVLTRRFSRMHKDAEEGKEGTTPDLLLIDGGKGHLSTVQTLMEELGVNIPFVCIAKGVDRNAGREWFHMPNKEPFQLPHNDPTLHYLQRLRDEVHRFAITTHRQKRAKQFVGSELDQIEGIGGVRKKALLHHFGSVKGVEAATLEELLKVSGLSRKMAHSIYDYFHG
jgi:excinuclease ABC subunit C